MKRLGITILLVVAACLMSGCAYLYAQFNIRHHTAYYVQHMPRKKGTNPELVLISDNIYFIIKPSTKKIILDNGQIQYFDNSVKLSLGSNYYLHNYQLNKTYVVDKSGKFKYGYTGIDEKIFTDKTTAQEAEVYSSKILSPFLKDAKKPLINLQWLFNRKYAKRFN